MLVADQAIVNPLCGDNTNLDMCDIIYYQMLVLAKSFQGRLKVVVQG